MGEKKLYRPSTVRIATFAILLLLLFLAGAAQADSGRSRFLAKAALLRDAVMADEGIQTLGEAPAGAAGHVVFFSLCDGMSRARVAWGRGESLDAAWECAVEQALAVLDVEGRVPLWVKADVVVDAAPATVDALQRELADSVSGFCFSGLALDERFEKALPEGLLNGTGVYDYEAAGVSLDALNDCLEDNGRDPAAALPGEVITFNCWGWLCDSDDAVYALLREGADYGRREAMPLDASYVEGLIDSASTFLTEQVREDGSFVYGRWPRFDRKVKGYNILRHCGAVWSLICSCRMLPGEALLNAIDRAIGYMLDQLVYDDSGAAYLYDEDSDEIKLGGSSLAVVMLTEYADAFDDDRYEDVCVALGEGILNLQDAQTGAYWHVLNRDLTRKDEFRTVYYDGEATFALARLYALTGDSRWLDAACRAIERFIAEDYTQYRDHWIAYSLNEVTKYVDDRQDFYDFALANAQDNYDRILDRTQTSPTNLELLMAVFETWRRMADRGADTGDFDVRELLKVISARAQRQLSGYFYPEYAMYMANPQRILGAFMMRKDDFRVRIDDVQHNIGGYYLYWKNYDALIEAGMETG